MVEPHDDLPIPAGWYGVLFSDEVARGEAVPLHAFGVDLVAFRGDDGVVGILDAHCPHMGAHLGFGGRVEGDCVVCPFHRWHWRADGTCATIPYTDRVPARAVTRSWPVIECNGFVFCWYHPRAEQPTWSVTEIPQTGAPGWSIRRRNEWGPFASHPQELNENGVDFAHFDVIHGFTIRGIDWVPDGPRYRLGYDMEPLTAGDGARSEATQQAQLAVPTRNEEEGNLSDAIRDVAPERYEYSLDSLTEGPGYTRSIMSGAIDAVSVHSWTPVDRGVIHVKSLYFFGPDTPDDVVDRTFENSRSGWEKDIQIWSHKHFAPKPLLVPGDGPVRRFRTWFDQFYVD